MTGTRIERQFSVVASRCGFLQPQIAIVRGRRTCPLIDSKHITNVLLDYYLRACNTSAHAQSGRSLPWMLTEHTRVTMTPGAERATSARKIEANRRNARASTGPRTVAGKARAAQNARRHGLNLPARYDPARAGEIDALARAIAGADAGAERLELASRIAAAQIDVERARRARLDIYPHALRERDAIARLAAIDRYEGRALSARKRAMCDYDDASYRRLPGHAGRHFGGTKPPGESAQDGGQRRPRHCRRVLQAFRQSIYAWDGPEAALIRSMIAESLRPTRPLPVRFAETKPTVKATPVIRCSRKQRSKAGRGAGPTLASHHPNAAAPCPRVTERSRDRRVGKARKAARQIRIEARRLAHPCMGLDQSRGKICRR